MKQRVKCDECGAASEYKRGERIPNICGLPTDGGGTCRGRMQPDGTVMEPGDSVGVVGVDKAASGSERTAVTLAGEKLPAWVWNAFSGMEEVRSTHWAVMPNGREGVVIIFRSGDARALFVEAVLRMGVKVNP